MNFRTNNRLMAVCGIAIATVMVLGSVVSAQEKRTTPIVVLDLSKVFDSHPRFKSRIDQIKASVKAEEGKIQQEGEQLKAQVQQLQVLEAGTPDFKQLESNVARTQARLQADMQLKRKGFLEEEAKVYFETYQEVQAEVKAFAENNRIGIVLRYSSEEIDQANRQSVLQGINQPIVYNQNSLDITGYIVTRVSRASQASRPNRPQQK